MSTPIPMLLWCPQCGERHVDAGDFATKPHHTHACQACGMVWRPAVVATCGVRFLPEFNDAERALTQEERALTERVSELRAALADPDFRLSALSRAAIADALSVLDDARSR